MELSHWESMGGGAVSVPPLPLPMSWNGTCVQGSSVVELVSRETCFPLSDKIPFLKITVNCFLQKSTHLLSLRPGFGTVKDKTDCWLYQKFGGQILPLLLLTLNKTSDCISSILRTQKKNPKKKPNPLFLEHCGWVLRSSSVFVLKHLVRRRLTLKFYFPKYQLERADLLPPFSLPCQLPFLTK